MKQRNIYTIIFLLMMSAICYAQRGSWQIFDTKTSAIIGNNITALTSDKNGLWIGSYQGLNIYNGRTWQNVANLNEKLKGRSIGTLYGAKNGTIWVGVDDYGIVQYDGGYWVDYEKQCREMGIRYVRDIVEDHDGTLWITVTLGGLVTFDGNVWEKYTPEDCDLSSDFVLDIAVDKANRKWITTNNGINVYNGRRWITYNIDNSDLPDNIVPAVLIDKDNVKWFGTASGLVRFDGEKWSVWNIQNSPLPSNQINDIVIDKEGRLWIATKEGVAVFDRDSRWCVFTSKNSRIPQGSIYKVFVGKEGEIWIGSEANGLAKISGFAFDELQEVVEAKPEPVKKEVEKPALPQKSNERIRINPHLESGYITITHESTSATVTFTNADGKVVRTINNYQNNQKISIKKMEKGVYSVSVVTGNGEKIMRFVLK